MPKTPTKSCADSRRAAMLYLYSIAIALFFLFLLGILSTLTNTWIYFYFLSVKTGLSVTTLKDIHYGFAIATAILWAYDAYKHSHEKHKKSPMKTHQIIDHHTTRIIKLAVLPFLATVFVLFIVSLALLQTFGSAAYEVRMKLPNDPTVYEFFSLIESFVLVFVGLSAHVYLLRRYYFWISKE